MHVLIQLEYFGATHIEDGLDVQDQAVNVNRDGTFPDMQF
jgi:hypothetical protein